MEVGGSERAGLAARPFRFLTPGAWTSEDLQNDSFPVDYLGLPLTEEGRIRALSYDESQKAMFERQCAHWGASYLLLGPFGMRIWSGTEAVRERIVSYTIGAGPPT